MRFALVLVALLALGACAKSAVQTMATVCGVYSSTLISLSTFKEDMTAGQIAIVDDAVVLLAPMCEGAEPTGDADALALASLDNLELLLLELRK